MPKEKRVIIGETEIRWRCILDIEKGQAMTTTKLLRDASEDELEIKTRKDGEFHIGEIWLRGRLCYECAITFSDIRAAKHHCLKVIREAKGK